MTLRHSMMSSVFSEYNNNIVNNNNTIFCGINKDKLKFFDDMIDVSAKCVKIENDINNNEQILKKKEEMLSKKLNDDNNGFWIEAMNKKNIFINQKEMNSLLSDCYDGLVYLKNMPESFDTKYELIKKTLFKNSYNN